jgi:hypothetical protein
MPTELHLPKIAEEASDASPQSIQTREPGPVTPSAATPTPVTARPVSDEPFSSTPAALPPPERTPASPSAVKPNEPIAPPPFPPAADDPFAPLKPTAAPSLPIEANTDDDPFAPAKTPPPTRVPASPTSATAQLQSTDPLLPAADGRLQLREWVDDSGSFRVQARLITILEGTILEGRVRLLKESGRTTTVPVKRLSAADQSYVAQIIARYGQELEKLDQLAAR